MSGSPTFDTEKKENRKIERGEFITPPRPTGRRSKNSKKVMAMNRRCFIKIIECCRVLARQNIAFQGASELNSNFHQILKVNR